jgi:hypothetical protein
MGLGWKSGRFLAWRRWPLLPYRIPEGLMWRTIPIANGMINRTFACREGSYRVNRLFIVGDIMRLAFLGVRQV